MAKKTSFKCVSGTDLLKRSDQFLSGAKFSKKIEGNLSPNFKFDIKFDTRSADFSFFNRGIKLGNERVIPALEAALNEAMSSSVWSWDSGPRDIVDSGTLRDSLSIQMSTSGINISYSAPYAGLIHYGGYVQPYGNTRIAKVYVPGRPWADSVLLGGGPVEIFDWQSIYRQAILDEFR